MKTVQVVVLSLNIIHIWAQLQPTPTPPVAILKQINRQNEDGSYSYGYEAADGSYKIETKSANGQVSGKYGYVDADGQRREVEYGASKERGFEPVGTGINVPPSIADGGKTEEHYDDGQYREDPRIYYDETNPDNNRITLPQRNFPRVQYTPQNTQPQTFAAPENTFSYTAPIKGKYNQFSGQGPIATVQQQSSVKGQPTLSYSVTYNG